MRASSTLFLLVALARHVSNLFPPTTTIEEICSQAAGSNPNVDYEFCVTSLESDPESSSADVHGLAIIATKLSIVNATSTQSKIEELLTNEEWGAYVKMCLEDCLEMYSGAIDQLSDAVDDIRVMDIEEAMVQLSTAMDAPSTCEDGFAEGGERSLLAVENRNFAGLSAIALNLTASLSQTNLA